MISYKSYISNRVQSILNTSKKIIVEEPPKEEMGDFSVPCFELRNEELKSPVDVANYLKSNFIDENHYFKKINVMGPYINFYLDYSTFNKCVIEEIESKKETYGSDKQGEGEKLLIEHTSINPNASPHIGRTRNALIGDFLSRLHSFVGYEVERHYFINDIGKQISMLLVGAEKYNKENLTFKDMLDLYIKINKESLEDEEINKRVFYYLNELENGNDEVRNKFKRITDICIDGQMEIFNKLDIHFDKFTHESDFVFSNVTNEILNKLKEKSRLHEDENGRFYVDLSGYDIPTKNPVLVLTREDKTSLYPLRDIAYTIYKLKLNDKNNFIILGEDQITYMKQISAVLDIMGYKHPMLTSYSFVLLNGNKMATREGTVVLLEEFLSITNSKLKESFEERGIEVNEDVLNKLTNASIKFSMLNVSKDKSVNFNIDNATSFNGESGIYILYSIVRMNSILRSNSTSNDELMFNNDIENKIIKDLYSFNELIDDLLNTKEPALLTKYVFNLTQKFSKFYEDVNVSNEKDEVLKSSRLRLISCIKTVLTNALYILGITTVEKM